ALKDWKRGFEGNHFDMVIMTKMNVALNYEICYANGDIFAMW
ncbi:24505_t:CDS:1, partial [Gigaspora margarita]